MAFSVKAPEELRKRVRDKPSPSSDGSHLRGGLRALIHNLTKKFDCTILCEGGKDAEIIKILNNRFLILISIGIKTVSQLSNF